MIRAPLGDQAYWDKWVDFSEGRTRKMLYALGLPSKNPNYDPQYSFDAAIEHIRLFLERYSRGDSVRELTQYFPGLLDAWSLSNRLANEVNAQLNPGQGWDHRHLLTTPVATDDPRRHTDPRSWTFKLSDVNHYNWCFWLVGLALALDIPDDQWQRLLLLIGGEGEDELLDRVIASRQPSRRIGGVLLHEKPYARLLKAINAPKKQEAEWLRDFVENWYAELKRKGNEELWWYIYGDPEKHPLEKGSYFGRWCIEAVAAVKAFGLDDSLCLGHEHYPGDLLRPDGPSTHRPRPETNSKPGILARLFKR